MAIEWLDANRTRHELLGACVLEDEFLAVGIAHHGGPRQGDALTLLHRCTEGNDRERMERWIRDLLRPHFLKLGWGQHLYEPNSSESTHGILAELLGTIGGDEQVREKCASLFNWWQACHAAVEESLLPALVNSIADSGAEEQYVEFVKLAQRANSARERRLFLEALGRFSSFDCETAMNTVLATATSDDQVLPILSAYVRTEGSAESAFHYIKKHWREIWLRFPPPSVLALLKSCSSLDTAPLQRELNDFFFHKILPPIEPGVPKSAHGAQDIVDTLVTVAANVHLRAQGGRAVARYLNLREGGVSFSQS